MATEVIFKVRDDIDGSDAIETIAFSIRGKSYEIDLSKANVELFDKNTDEFIKHARPIAREAESPAHMPGAGASNPAQLKRRRKEIRGWADRNGWPGLIDTRGHIPGDAVEAYMAAHPEVELEPELIPRARKYPKKKDRPSRRKDDDLTSVTAQEALEFGGDAAQVMQQKTESPQARSARIANEKREELFGGPISSEQNREIKAWARKNGWPDVAISGHAPMMVLEAYLLKHPNARAAK